MKITYDRIKDLTKQADGYTVTIKEDIITIVAVLVVGILISLI